MDTTSPDTVSLDIMWLDTTSLDTSREKSVRWSSQELFIVASTHSFKKGKKTDCKRKSTIRHHRTTEQSFVFSLRTCVPTVSAVVMLSPKS